MRMLTSHRQEMLPWCTASVAVMRMAGFPFAWLGLLTAPDTVAVAARLQRAIDEVGSFACAARSADLRRRAVTSGDRHLLRALYRGRELRAGADDLSPEFARLRRDFVAALDEREAAAAAYQHSYASDCDQSSNALIAAFRQSAALRDMLLVTNEDAYPRFTRWLDEVAADRAAWTKKDRNNINTLARYFQRVCAKNDTTSHFGPLATARLASDHDGVQWRPAPLERRTMLSRWAALCLAGKLAEDPVVWPLLRPRKSPGATLVDDRLHLARLNQSRRTTDIREALSIAEPVPLDPDLIAVYQLCDGERPLGDIAIRLGAEPGVVMTVLRRLEALGAVLIGPELPYGEEDALGYLGDWLRPSEAARPAQVVCGQFAAAVTELSTAATSDRPAALDRLKSLFTNTTGQPAQREGGFYSDRSVFHEHCLGFAGDLVVGEPLITRMRDELSLLYDMFLLRPRLRLRLERELLLGWFVERFGSARVPVVQFVTAFLADLDELEVRYAGIDERIADIGRALEEALLPPAADPGHVHRVSRRMVEQLIQRHGVPEPAICNPDLMIAACSAGDLADGAFRLVVGDLHAMDDHLSHGSIAPFVDAAFPGYRREVLDLYRGLLEPGEWLADVTQWHRNKTFPRIEPGCLDIEAHDRSGLAASRRVRLADLTVRPGLDRLLLCAPDDEALRLMVPPLAWPMPRRNPFAVFAFPADTEGAAVHGEGRTHLPRIEVGDVILQRELWRVPARQLAAASVTEEPEAFLRVRELVTRLGLPRHVFFKGPAEPKPVYCDLESPLLVRQLTRSAAAAGESGTVTISEMLPGPDDLWLRADQGARTCEIRYAVFNRPAAETGAVEGEEL